jgi:hypothetical protein
MVSEGSPARKERWECLALGDYQVLQDQPEEEGVRELEALQDHWGLLENQDHQEVVACRELMDPLDQRANLVKEAKKVLQDPKEN